jgi:hypothetical protein
MELRAIGFQQIAVPPPDIPDDPFPKRARKIRRGCLPHDACPDCTGASAAAFWTAPEIDGMIALDRLKTGRHGEDLCEQRFHYLTDIL